ncbi:dnaJ protein P58IPK homolog A-like [Salvia hispanica]|uniref:dnaJ protein P58IPK homolog A-like n=1 Tax=Salvia hispanica TaxID=49212 RepID=UPI0020098EEF|nr:dnaJ protein P58IPK homolog A-like [Salvia hispanica]
MMSALSDPVNITNMECNKDEATRAKSIAESMIDQMDYLGAKKLALKAQALYPELYGITQLLTTLDVYLSGEKIDGEVDWYRVLCVNPSDDHDTIKKQFKKLALKLHPDKNTSVGADGAFKLISEAWNLLSDEEKRVAYNQRRGYGRVQKTVLTQTGGPSAPCGAWNHAHTRASQQNVPSASPRQSKRKAPSVPSQQKVPSASPRKRKKKVPSVPSQPSQQNVPGHTGGPSAAAHTAGRSNSNSTWKSRSETAKKARTQNPASYHVRSDTFWTVCRGCNRHLEYLKM